MHKKYNSVVTCHIIFFKTSGNKSLSTFITKGNKSKNRRTIVQEGVKGKETH